MATIKKLATIVRVQLGNGTVWVEAGERLDYAADGAYGGRKNCWLTPMREHRERTDLTLSPTDQLNMSLQFGRKPARPVPPYLASLAPEGWWYSVGDDDFGECVEARVIDEGNLERMIVVFREGLSVTKGELVRVVNTAHAALALRGAEEYFYLCKGFVLSAREEEALIEWGLGRPVFANSLLAVGGTLLVFYAENLWRTGVVGTLLVTATGYRVQGALTKVLRVRSAAWSDHLLVSSGIHGAERAVQCVLVTIMALADLLDDRVLLLTGLVLASVQVVVLESVGQAVLTWGVSVHRHILCVQLGVWASVCAGMAAVVWLLYVFAGSFVFLSVDIVAAGVGGRLAAQFLRQPDAPLIQLGAK